LPRSLLVLSKQVDTDRDRTTAAVVKGALVKASRALEAAQKISVAKWAATATAKVSSRTPTTPYSNTYDTKQQLSPQSPTPDHAHRR